MGASLAAISSEWETAERDGEIDYGLEEIDAQVVPLEFGRRLLRHKQPRMLPIRRTRDELRQRFEALYEQWEADTAFAARVIDSVIHPSFQQIIGLGPDGLPFILRKLEETGSSDLFWALRAIAGEDVSISAQSIPEATAMWLSWGARLGYR